jgi:hypothetical protein
MARDFRTAMPPKPPLAAQVESLVLLICVHLCSPDMNQLKLKANNVYCAYAYKHTRTHNFVQYCYTMRWYQQPAPTSVHPHPHPNPNSPSPSPALGPPTVPMYNTPAAYSSTT